MKYVVTLVLLLQARADLRTAFPVRGTEMLKRYWLQNF